MKEESRITHTPRLPNDFFHLAVLTNTIVSADPCSKRSLQPPAPATIPRRSFRDATLSKIERGRYLWSFMPYQGDLVDQCCDELSFLTDHTVGFPIVHVHEPPAGSPWPDEMVKSIGVAQHSRMRLAFVRGPLRMRLHTWTCRRTMSRI